MMILQRVKLWLRSLFSRGRVEAELDAEIRFHIGRTIEHNIRKGMSPAEARRKALLKFGGVEQVKEEVRDARGNRPLDDFLSDLRFATRSLRRRPGLSTAVLATLALGIGVNTAIFSILYGAVLRELPYPEAEQLMWVYDRWEAWGPDGEAALSIPNFEDLRHRTRLFEDLVAFQVRSFNVTGDDEPTRARGVYASAGLLGLLRTDPQIGRPLLPEDDVEDAAPVVILSDPIWRDRFGASPDVLGREITIDGVPHTVVGVMPPGFLFLGDPQLLIPFALPSNKKVRGARNVRVIGRLAQGVSKEAAAAELANIFEDIRREFPETNERWTVVTVPFRDRITGRTRSPLIVLAGAVVLVLLVACANVVTLMLARSESRRTELGVRSALGASRFRLVRLSITEALLLSVLGGLLALIAAEWGLAALLAAFGDVIPRSEEVAVNGPVLWFTLLISLLTGLGVGALTGIRGTPQNPQDVLKEGASVSPPAGRRLRQGLVVFQVALALMLTTGAGLLVKNVWRLQQVDLGMRPEKVLHVQISLPSAKYAQQADVVRYYSSIINSLSKNPGIKHAAAINRLGLTHGHSNIPTVLSVDDPEIQANQVEVRLVTKDYFSTVGIPLVAGRTFLDSDGPGSQEVVIVSEELAGHLFGDTDPVGRQLNPRGPDRSVEVVGVVEDVREFGPTIWPRPTIYWHQAQTQNPDIHSSSLVLRTTADPLDFVPFVRETILKSDEDLPVFGIASMENLFGRSIGGQRFLMSILSLFAALTVVLGGVGVYGLMAFSVAQRISELGLRFALGQSSRQAVLLVLWQGSSLALLGVCVGTFGTFATVRVLSHLLFDMSAYDPVIFIASPCFLLSVSLLACYSPARLAAGVDPLCALRGND